MILPEPITASTLIVLAGLSGQCDTNDAAIITKAFIRPTKYHMHVKSSDDLHGAIGTASGGWTTQAEAEFTQDSSGCIYIKRVDVKIYHEPQIHIVKDYAPGTCGHKYVSEHERAHVNINKNMLNRFSEEIKVDLRQTLRSKRGVKHNQNQLFDVVMKRLRVMTEDLTKKLNKMHKQQLDNPQEYARVHALIQENCGGN